MFLDSFSNHLQKRVEEGYEVWLAVDKAGWHLAKELKIPENIRLIVMPTGAATINPIETLWDFVRKNFTRCKVHKTLEELEETLDKAANYLIKSAQKVISICHTSIINKCHLD